MSEEYWVAAYILAGVAVTIGVIKYIDWAYDNDMDYTERREWELTNTVMNTSPVARAMFYLIIWVMWPLIAASGLLIGIAILGTELAFLVLDGWDWLVWKVRNR